MALTNILPYPLNVPQGSKVYVYDAGTVNLATVYADTYYTVSSNPLTVDNYGRVNCLAEDGAYDVKVCDGDTDAQLYAMERLIATSVFTDAVQDGKEYVRKNGAWSESSKGLEVTNNNVSFA